MDNINVDELIELLPQLVRDNDRFRGAILSVLSGIVATKDDLKDLIKYQDERFEAIQHQMDVRFEAIQHQIDERFEAIQHQMDERFEAMDKRFEALNSRFDELILINSRFESKEGKNFEKMVFSLMKETLKIKNIDINKIRNIHLEDREGNIFPPNYVTDIDVLLENGDLILLEVKSSADQRDLIHLLMNAKLYEHVHKKKPTQLMIVALRIKEDAFNYALDHQIRVVKGSIY